MPAIADKMNAVHLLMYALNCEYHDITIKNNTFYNPRRSLYYSASGKIPKDYSSDNNIIFRNSHLESKTGVFTVVIPKYAESTEDQRRNRVMPDITWEAQLAGAVHQVKTKGVLRATL